MASMVSLIKSRETHSRAQAWVFQIAQLEPIFIKHETLHDTQYLTLGT